jgi:hypothetical protein
MPIEEFDRQVDGLWEDVSPAYTVIGRRDATWLRWRFDQCPDKGSYRRYYLMAGDRVVGYLVLRPTEWNQEPTLTIVDYLAAPRDLAALFGRAVLVARRHRVTALRCHTLNYQAHFALRSLGFLRRGDGVRFLVYMSDTDLMREAVLNPNNWFLTAADSDVD